MKTKLILGKLVSGSMYGSVGRSVDRSLWSSVSGSVYSSVGGSLFRPINNSTRWRINL